MDDSQQSPRPDSPAPEAAPEAARSLAHSSAHFPVVGIGASAGGLPALMKLLENMPPAPGIALVVVLHLSPDHPSAADRLLQRATPMPVVQVSRRMRLRANQVYVISPGRSLTMEAEYLVAGEQPCALGIPMTINIFLRTLAEAHGRQAIGVILSGMGTDGVAGLACIKEHGGLTIAQLPGDAEEGSMPQAAIDSGMVDFVLPAAQVPGKLIECRDALAAGEAPPPVGPRTEETLESILALVCARTGHDFHHYKPASILRRVECRLRRRDMPDLASYCRLLHQDAHEAEALLQDLLIGTTDFFRDRDALDAVARTVLPRILHDNKPGEPLRAWVAGCSTGAAAYSLGMLLADHVGSVAGAPEMQIFATDADERAIAVARIGRYPDAIAADVPADRLARYFVLEDEHFTVRKRLRDRILFARHDLLRDPAFSKLDMISCRNVLIHLDREHHRQVLELFHAALKPGGYLFLGEAESADLAPDLFSAVNARYRIYQAKPLDRKMRGRFNRLPAAGAARPLADHADAAARRRGPRLSAFAEVHQRRLARLAPPSLLLSEGGDVLHACGRAAAFLRYGGGEPSAHVLSLVLPALRAGLRSALSQARNSGMPAVSLPVRVGYERGHERGHEGAHEGGQCVVRLSVVPIREGGPDDGLMLVQFETMDDLPAESAGEGADPAVRRLEEALREARRNAERTVEQAEAAGADMALASDELRDTVQALRADIEALETESEELQSRNEELYTVNAELQMRVEDTAKAHDDLSNLIASTGIATLFVDGELRIQRFTPYVTRIFNIIAADVGRPLAHLASKLDTARLFEDVETVFSTLQPVEREMHSKDGHDYIVRVHPYRTGYDRVEGLVLTFFDISRRRMAEEALRQSEEHLRAFVTASSDVLYKMSADWSEMRTLQGRKILADTDSPTCSWVEKYIPVEERPRVLEAIAHAIATRSIFELEHRVIRADGGLAWTFSRAIPLLDEAGEVVEWFGTSSDITERKLAEAAVRESEARFRALAEASPALIWQVDVEGRLVYVNQRCLEVTGITLEALRGSFWHAIVHADDADGYRDAVAGALDGEHPLQRRVRLRIGDGSHHWFESHGLPWYAGDGAFRGLVGISIDVNEAVQAEEALRTADRRKDEFLATLAHELRNPLAPISNALQFLRHPEGKRNIDRLLAMVERQVRQMVRLVDDLMEVTRISRGKVDLRRAPVPVAEVIDSALETSQPAFAQKGQQLDVSVTREPLMLDADKVRLTQVFANLLNNAAKYTAPGGRIWLTVGRGEHEVLVTVRDTGMGIPEAQLPLIFEMFSQPHGRDGHTESGLGIGLAMVRSLVQMHGGTVEAHSGGSGQGSEFVVHLPLGDCAAACAMDDGAAAPDGMALAGRRILVVDDNRDAADSLCQLLSARGADARAVYGGRAAIDALEHARPDAVVLDIGMPDLDGYEVAQRIRQDKRVEGIRIVALSGWGQRADRERSKACGFDHHLTKPAEVDTLVRILAS